MILTDTSVWVDHFRGAERADGLRTLLELDEVLLHRWVLGELALGFLGPSRTSVVRDLAQLPEAPRVDDRDVLELIAARSLTGRGIGWVDAQLLASALVAGCGLWTFDQKLASVAQELGVPASV